MVEKAQSMWDTMHQDKTNMLWSKEEYYNSKQSYRSSQDKIEALKSVMSPSQNESTDAQI
tara:strand:+ start:364 stop:543 length:180 start_codon:yes stop_codon:yes gene_type:complete